MAIYARGANLALWASEVRVTNRTSTTRTFRVVDFVGVLSSVPISVSLFSPGTFSVPPGTSSWGAYDLLSPPPSTCGGPGGEAIGLGEAYFGAFVLDADPALIVEAAVLGRSYSPGGGPGINCPQHKCETWQGGYAYVGFNDDWCNQGAGPLFEGTAKFYVAGAQIFLSWLHTQPSRRTNVTFYNPDTVAATVTLTIASGDGFSVQTNVSVPAHFVWQLNDVFSSPPFDAVRTHNGGASATATATIVSTTRLYAIGWVISNLNNTVSIAVPR